MYLLDLQHFLKIHCRQVTDTTEMQMEMMTSNYRPFTAFYQQITCIYPACVKSLKQSCRQFTGNIAVISIGITAHDGKSLVGVPAERTQLRWGHVLPPPPLRNSRTSGCSEDIEAALDNSQRFLLREFQWFILKVRVLSR